MGSSGAVINQVLILFFIMLIGFIARKSNILNSSVNKKLSELLLKITSPLMVISSFQIDFTREILENVLIVFIFSITAHIASILLGHLLFRRSTAEKKKVMKFSAIYPNCGYMGFPLLESIFGGTGVLYGSVYVAVFNVFLWTNGVMIFTGSEKLNGKAIKKAMLNPGIVSVIIGILLFIFSIKLPGPAAKAIDLVGSMTVPLSMLIIGATIADCEFRKLLSGWELYYTAVIRLILLPVLAFAALKLLGLPDMLLKVCTLLVAMPVAATTAIFAELYDGDTIFASRVVVLTTLASIVTIPLLMMII
jgi:hypothetical protein